MVELPPVPVLPEKSFHRDTETGENRGWLFDANNPVRSEPCSVASFTATLTGPSAGGALVEARPRDAG